MAALLGLLTALGANVARAADEAQMPEVAKGCASCHQKGGQPALIGWPYLAGMEKARLVEILQGHRASRVPDSTMDKIAAGLTDNEIDAVADYFSKLERTDPPPLPIPGDTPE